MRYGRLNLTFRDVTDGRIDTNEFPRYRVCYDDAGNAEENLDVPG